jgi:hypothetical protein
MSRKYKVLSSLFDNYLIFGEKIEKKKSSSALQHRLEGFKTFQTVDYQ